MKRKSSNHDVETPDYSASDFRARPLILVAEDEPITREVAIQMLQRAGYATVTAGDGEEAVRVFEETQPDVAVLDAVMPKLNAREAFERMTSSNANAKAVFCSAYDRETSGASVLEAEGLTLIQKPFDAQTLLTAVRAVLADPPHHALPMHPRSPQAVRVIRREPVTSDGGAFRFVSRVRLKT